MDYVAFKKDIYKLTSINLNYYKEKQMKRRIDSLRKKNGDLSYEEYLRELKKNDELLNEFINFLTINVTEFYRNPEQWEVLKNEILPGLLKKKQKLKIWSAACSTGEEPYTLVMLLNNFTELRDIAVLASDIDKEALRKAKEGIYNKRSLEKLHVEYISRYFTKKDDFFVIKDNIKSRVEFFYLDLLKDKYPADCDLIVCRNVLIYFTEEAKDLVYSGFSKSLNEGGVLFIGSTEQIMNAHRYNLAPSRNFFYYKISQTSSNINKFNPV